MFDIKELLMIAVEVHVVVSIYVVVAALCAKISVQLVNLVIFALTIIIAAIFYRWRGK
jgi:hypothetical protein